MNMIFTRNKTTFPSPQSSFILTNKWSNAVHGPANDEKRLAPITMKILLDMNINTIDTILINAFYFALGIFYITEAFRRDDFFRLKSQIFTDLNCNIFINVNLHFR